MIISSSQMALAFSTLGELTPRDSFDLFLLQLVYDLKKKTHFEKRLGDGTVIDRKDTLVTQVVTSGVLSGKNIVQVAAGSFFFQIVFTSQNSKTPNLFHHSGDSFGMALDSNGGLFCWGDNSQGQFVLSFFHLMLTSAPHSFI